ncbi:MAG: hypothetical protein WCJ41_00645 [Aestuariivirga sp.]|uniref:hypothetical protein n=1 Tax=Aestuariivirga sp. TaxID=2650926 RepID=UPI003019BFE1
MIISHSRRFILVKSRKTASTSIERAIIPQLDGNDIWTPISIPPVAGRNYYSAWPIDLMTAKLEWFRDLVGRDSVLHRRFFFDHMPLARARPMLPAAQFGSYRKYAFDRNPWDFLVSLYFFSRRKPPVAGWDFDRFLHEYPVVQNRSLYTEDDVVIADRVFRFEELAGALGEISAETGLSFASLPEDKRSYRGGTDYRSHYSASSRDLVAERWADTIALLGYDF